MTDDKKGPLHGSFKLTNAMVTTTTVKQEAIPELGREAKEMHYVVITTGKGKRVINVGKETITEVKKLLE